MTNTTAKDWTNRLITGLFTAAAAWGSVNVLITKTVNDRAAITEQRIELHVSDELHGAERYLSNRQDMFLDSITVLIHGIAHGTVELAPRTILVPAPRDTSNLQSQREMLEKIDAVNERLRYVAQALARIHAAQQEKKPEPSGPYWNGK